MLPEGSSSAQLVQAYLYGFGSCVGLVVFLGGILYGIIKGKLKGIDEHQTRNEERFGILGAKVIELSATCAERNKGGKSCG